jgi:arsenate reductase
MQRIHILLWFSKIWWRIYPKSEFAAIWRFRRSFIAGAEKRIPITYEDPKAFDNTPQQAEKYQERSLQIATEMLYVFFPK